MLGPRGCVLHRAAPAKRNITVINGLSGDFLPARANIVVGESAMTAAEGKMLFIWLEIALVSHRKRDTARRFSAGIGNPLIFFPFRG